MVMRRTNKRTGKRAAAEPARTRSGSFPRPAEEEKPTRRETPWSELPDDSFASEETEETDEAAADEPAAPTEVEGEDAHAPDDALGLYLRQMGAIPLLNREQELALAERLELKRRRYRHAALLNWRTLARIVETFERVRAGQLALDPTIDVVTTLGLSREQHPAADAAQPADAAPACSTTADADFRTCCAPARRPASTALRRDLWRRLHKADRPGRGTVAAHRPARPLDRRAARPVAADDRTRHARSTPATAPPPTASAAPRPPSSCAT